MRWYSFPDMYWGEVYFGEVAEGAVHVLPTIYETEIRIPRAYTQLMKDYLWEFLFAVDEWDFEVGLNRAGF